MPSTIARTWRSLLAEARTKASVITNTSLTSYATMSSATLSDAAWAAAMASSRARSVAVMSDVFHSWLLAGPLPGSHAAGHAEAGSAARWNVRSPAAVPGRRRAPVRSGRLAGAGLRTVGRGPGGSAGAVPAGRGGIRRRRRRHLVGRDLPELCPVRA